MVILSILYFRLILSNFLYFNKLIYFYISKQKKICQDYDRMSIDYMLNQTFNIANIFFI